jgi:membrane-associated phospholipid phosphatase
VINRFRQGSGHLALLLLMVAAIVVLGAAVTVSATVGRFDFAVAGEATSAATQPLTALVIAVTTLGATEVILLVTAIGLAGLAAVRHWHGFMTLALSVAATELVVHAVKVLVERPRPPEEEALTQAAGFSFPSGHAATAVAVYAVLALVVGRRCCDRTRVILAVVGALIVLGIGASRVYLGVHYPTDVIAGWLTGGALALGSWLIATRVRLPGAPAAPSPG